ncbi:MAG: AI-2E family transporter [bacterium]
MESEDKTHSPYARLVVSAAILAAIVVIALFVKKASGVITVFAISAAIAYIINPLVDKLAARRVPRVVATLSVFVVFIAAVGGVAVAIAPILASQFQELIKNLPDYFAAISGLWERAVETFRKTELPPSVKEIPAAMGQNLQSVGGAVGKKVYNGIVGFFSQLPSVIIIPILVFYFLNDGHRIRRTFISYLPPAHRGAASDLLDRLNGALGGYIRGQVKLCLVMGVLSWIALAAVGVKYSLVFGTIAGVTEFIPYVGPILGIIGPLIFALFTSWVMVVKVLIVFVVLQVLESFLAPRVMSGDVGMHPALILFILMAGGQVAGLAGMIAALPAAVVLKTLIEFFYLERVVRPLEVEEAVKAAKEKPSLVKKIDPDQQ